jgi:lysophospholipase L1-like esterase
MMRYLLAFIAVALLACCSGQPNLIPPPSTQPASPTQATILPRPSTQPITRYHQIVVIGDSYTEGSSEGGQGANGWPALVWGDLQTQGLQVRPIVAGEGSAGYATPGYQGTTLGDVARIVLRYTHDAELVVFFGGSNDSDIPPERLGPAALAAFTTAKTAAPAATLMVIGPVWPGPNPPPKFLRVRDTIRDQAQIVGAVFVDPIAEGWMADTPELIGADGVHPTNDGHKYLAARIAPLIRNALK